MNNYTITGLALLYFFLFNDFRKDKGMHAKAKITHTIILTIIILLYADAYKYFWFIVKDFEQAKLSWCVDIGIIPSYIVFASEILHTALSIIILLTAYSLSVRKAKSKNKLHIYLPLIAICDSISFYNGWISDTDFWALNDWVIILIGLMLPLFIFGIIIYLYNKPKMIMFLERLKEV
jgi:hypothetical protein